MVSHLLLFPFSISLGVALRWEEGAPLDNSTMFFPWTAFYGFAVIWNMEDNWKLKCYKTGKGGEMMIEQCADTCVIKFTLFPNGVDQKGRMRFANATSYHCQDLDTYPPSFHHVCSNNVVEYPNLRSYINIRTMNKTYLYCCNTELCNEPGKYFPIEPQPFMQTEHTEMEHYDIATFLVALLLVAALVLWPFFQIWKVAKEDAWLEQELHKKIERAVVLMEHKPKLVITKETKPVTGQLPFGDYLHHFLKIKSFQPVRKPKRHVVIAPQDSVEVVEHWAGGHGHDLVCADRATWVRYDDVQQPGRATMQTVLEHGPYAYDWKPIDLVELFDQAMELFSDNEVLVEIALPVCVIGDIRGHYTDLWRWLQLVGVPPKTKLLFLGGVIDPDEPGSLDCLALISVMKVAFPQHVFLLRGVPESMKVNFGSRFDPTNDAAIASAATRLCSHLPIACRIHLRILAVHSGISHLLTDFESFGEVKRPFDLEEMPTLARQLIFNEPTTRIKMYRESSHEIGHFGFQAVSRLCNEIGFDFIIRSRHYVQGGIMWNEKGRLVSLWSAPGKQLKEEDGSTSTATAGAILLLDGEGKQKVYRLYA